MGPSQKLLCAWSSDRLERVLADVLSFPAQALSDKHGSVYLMHRNCVQPLSCLSGTRLLGFLLTGRMAWWEGQWEHCARGLVALVNSLAGPKLSREVIHKAPLVRECSSPALNEHWQLRTSQMPGIAAVGYV